MQEDHVRVTATSPGVGEVVEIAGQRIEGVEWVGSVVDPPVHPPTARCPRTDSAAQHDRSETSPRWPMSPRRRFRSHRFEQQLSQRSNLVGPGTSRIGVNLDQPAHPCGLVDENRLAGPRHGCPESSHFTGISRKIVPVGGLKEPDDVETVTPPLLGTLVTSVEPRVELAGDERQAARNRDRDGEFATTNVNLRWPSRRLPVSGDEESVLVVQFATRPKAWTNGRFTGGSTSALISTPPRPLAVPDRSWPSRRESPVPLPR